MVKIVMQSIERPRVRTVADRVYDSLYEQILTLRLPPNSKLSEVEVSKQMNISRQPVREAFFRLSQLGFLLIRPQRATIVRPISESDVLQYMYVRSALEAEVIRTASLNNEDLGVLSDLLDQQRRAIESGDKILFHTLDDAFHKHICIASDSEFVWSVIKDKKAHMDRVRYLSLSFGSEAALNEHLEIFEAIKSNDSQAAIDKIREHLSRIRVDLPKIKMLYPQYFEED